MYRKIPPIEIHIQQRRHKALQIKRNKLLIDRNQTYTLLREWASCAGRHFQDNVNTEMEIQRRWHTVFQVKGIAYWYFGAKFTSLVFKMHTYLRRPVKPQDVFVPSTHRHSTRTGISCWHPHWTQPTATVVVNSHTCRSAVLHYTAVPIYTPVGLS